MEIPTESKPCIDTTVLNDVHKGIPSYTVGTVKTEDILATDCNDAVDTTTIQDESEESDEDDELFTRILTAKLKKMPNCIKTEVKLSVLSYINNFELYIDEMDSTENVTSENLEK